MIIIVILLSAQLRLVLSVFIIIYLLNVPQSEAKASNLTIDFVSNSSEAIFLSRSKGQGHRVTKYFLL